MKSQHIATTIVILITFEIKGYVQEEAKSTCGRRLVNHKALITDGFQTKEGDWPWHAAIYHISTNDFKYKCGGTVLNLNSILTAAHCVFENNRRITVERVYVSLGKHDLILHGTNTQDFRAHKIITHPDFDISNLRNDIAVIRLKTEAYFNNYVQPICLWDKNKVEISEVIGKRGIVIGWGITETDEVSDTLRQGFMPVVSSIDCLESNRDVFGTFLSNNNFCAGFRNGTSVCNGDSGGSITFEENGVYHIRGIVSLAVSRKRDETEELRLCHSKEYVLFTDVAKYLTWIDEVLHTSDTSKSENQNELTFQLSGNVMWSSECEFYGGDFQNQISKKEDCDDICSSNKACTHFTWISKYGGLCLMKKFETNTTAKKVNDGNTVCGWIVRNKQHPDGNYPDYVACPTGVTYPKCQTPKCPNGTIGAYPNCRAVCRPGIVGMVRYICTLSDSTSDTQDFTGNYANATVIRLCPTGIGTYPDCMRAKCPNGTSGTYPDCVRAKCPNGTIGTYPNCRAICRPGTIGMIRYICTLDK